MSSKSCVRLSRFVPFVEGNVSNDAYKMGLELKNRTLKADKVALHQPAAYAQELPVGSYISS
jgi:hypothetical protein